MGRATKIKNENKERKEASFLRSLHASRKGACTLHRRFSDDAFSSICNRFPGFQEYLREAGKNIQNWKPRGKTRRSKKINCLKWALQYPVPKFLLEEALNPQRTVMMIARDSGVVELRWNVIALRLGKGGSLYREARGAFSRKEAHYFLNGPYNTAIENAWFAKLKAAKVKEKMIFSFVAHAKDRIYLSSPRWGEFIRFISRYDISTNELKDLMDFVDRGWDHIRTFRKRTLNSLRTMMEEWHRFELSEEEKGQSWEGTGIEPWIFKGVSGEWEITEILTAKSLAQEAKEQRHCVGHYLSDCMGGRCSIFSVQLHGRQSYRVTLEVVPGHTRVTKWCLVQARAKMNRSPTYRAKSVIRRWANEKSIACPW